MYNYISQYLPGKKDLLRYHQWWSNSFIENLLSCIFQITSSFITCVNSLLLFTSCSKMTLILSLSLRIILLLLGEMLVNCCLVAIYNTRASHCHCFNFFFLLSDTIALWLITFYFSLYLVCLSCLYLCCFIFVTFLFFNDIEYTIF